MKRVRIRAALMMLLGLLGSTPQAAEHSQSLLLPSARAAWISRPNLALEAPPARPASAHPSPQRTLRKVGVVGLVAVATAGLLTALLYFVVFPRTARAAGDSAARSGPHPRGPLVDN
jgi:hypothetical protein